MNPKNISTKRFLLWIQYEKNWIHFWKLIRTLQGKNL